MSLGFALLIFYKSPISINTFINISAQLSTFDIYCCTRSKVTPLSRTTRLRNFNLYSCTRSDWGSKAFCRILTISIHAPARGATTTSSTTCRIGRFQSTLLHEERPRFDFPAWQIKQFQSTLLHEERPKCGHVNISSQVISIHAPARGATLVGVYFTSGYDVISIHAPARGATLLK